MHYRLIKDLPDVPEGTILKRTSWDKTNDDEFLIVADEKAMPLLRYFPSATRHLWLEEVSNYWQPEDGETYWYVNTTLKASKAVRQYSQDEERFKIGNCFEHEIDTKELASRMVSLLADYQKEINKV